MTQEIELAPHSQESEEAVLGALLINPEAMIDVEPHINPVDFFIVRHGWIYDAMLAIRKRGDAIDTRTLAEELKDRKQLEDVGGTAYIEWLPTCVPTALHAEVYARMVARAALKRRVLTHVSNIARMAYDGEMPATDMLAKAQQLIMSESLRHQADMTISIGQVASSLYDTFERMRMSKSTLIGIASSFTDLDNVTGGFQKGTYTLLAGRPGMGKSAAVLKIAYQAAMDGNHVLLFTSEMDAEQVMQRLFAQVHGVSLPEQRRMTQEQWGRYVAFTGEVQKLPLYINDSARLTPMEIARICREHVRLYGRLDLVIDDYIQRRKGDRHYAKKNEEISDLAREMKELAREFHCATISAAQLSRAVEQRQDKRPELSDLAESGTLEREADIVLFLYRDGYYNEDSPQPNVVELKVAKHRNGATPRLLLVWDGPNMRFNNAVIRNMERTRE